MKSISKAQAQQSFFT